MYAFNATTLHSDVATAGSAPVLFGLRLVGAIEQTDVAILSGVAVSDVDLDPKNDGLGDYGGTFLLVQGDTLDTVDQFSLVAGPNFSINGPVLLADGRAFASYSVRNGEIEIDFYPSSVAGVTATSALVNEVMQAVRYRNGSDSPAARTSVTVAFGDNSPGGQVAAGTIPIEITAINDDPVNTVPLSQMIPESSDLVFSVSNGNAVFVSDPEATTLEVTIGASHGTLTLAGTNGLTLLSGDGVDDTLMTFRGSANAINAALDGLVFHGTPGYRGQAGLYVRSSDLGGSGLGGTLTDKDVVAITLRPKGDLVGDAGDNDFGGGEEADRFLFQQGGNDHGVGRGGDDLFIFGDQWSAGDSVEGGSGTDTLQLTGDYQLRFGETQIGGIEQLLLIGGPTGTAFDYWLQMGDGNVAAGAQLRVDGRDLVGTETLTFDGSAERDGAYEILGGYGADSLTGGGQDDILIGGNGADTLVGLRGNDRLTGGMGADLLNAGNGLNVFVYASAAESTASKFDTIQGFDRFFDRVDLPFTVRGWTGEIASGALRTASFGSDLGKAVNAALEGHSAVLFTPDSGDYAGRTFVVIDGDGNGTYQAVQDYVIEFAQPVYALEMSSPIFI
ncbi:calcium-binding protein [Allosphingosinicella deserti]|uniref:Peptidase M10 serralysin C-terminal domain-containing protein n=1 Tax=Allosphingosinicella deserti TaxID=2116704 RepID=A0A2P7QKR6_9SPHN|nr:hypothetical protein [Sphingomonas deserti]PSJ38530.1 hypothetical protein C7I55_19080 [Sphingomonas deserti]